MTPSRTINLLRTLLFVFAVVIGGTVAEATGHSAWFGTIVGAILGLVTILIDRLLDGIRIRIFSAATFGLVLGLVFAHLLRASDVLAYVPEKTAWMISLGVYCFFGYLGIMLAVRSNRDEFALIIPYIRFRQQSVQEQPTLIDTNIIIDGRIGDLCAGGFIRGPLIVPRFVLSELQRMADSSDPLKREKGRRGLAKLNEMQLSDKVGINVHEISPDSHGAVDTSLIQLARLLGARIISNDTGLAAVARLQKISIINLNDLGKALQPKDLPGDEIELQLVREGREFHQAVGYKPDGTMVVVNNARQFIGEKVSVVIASSVLTHSGRLTFAELSMPAPEKAAA